MASSKPTPDVDGDLTGAYNGIAPDASIVVVKAFDRDGFSTYVKVISAIDFVVTYKDVYGIRVLNLSLSEIRRLLNTAGANEDLTFGDIKLAAGSMPHDEPTITFGVQSSILIDSSLAAKPPKTMEWIAPIRAQASMAMAASGVWGM